jgi:hypothetical protein
MPAVKIRKDELEIVKAAALRMERRNNSRFIMDQTRIEITDQDSQPLSKGAKDEPEDKPSVRFG